MRTTHMLGDIITLHYGKSLPERSRTAGNFIVYGSGGAVGTHDEALVKGPGIIVGRKGTIGSVHWSSLDFFPIDTTYFVEVIDSDITIRFAYYLLRSLPLSEMNTSAAVPGLNRNNACRLEVNLPRIEQRIKIEKVLSAYDRLIQNNKRRVTLLENSARLLYREWFIQSCFLGNEGTSVQNFPKKPLKEVANLTMGQSPASKFYNKAGEGLPFHQGVTDYGVRFVEDRVFSTHATKLAIPNDILVSVRAPVGRINVTKNKIVLGRGLAAVNSKSGHSSFLLYALKELFFKENIIGTGVIYAAVTKNLMENLQLPNPPSELKDRFDKLVSPIDRQISNLVEQNKALVKARDFLLPRLMDGRIEI